MPRPKKQDAPRRRYSGFKLLDNPRDRVVAEWIDSQPNAAESIKALIYAVATGQIGRFGGGVSEADEDAVVERGDPRAAALLAALDD